MVVLKYKHEACAALLNLSGLEPLTWPTHLKFISELNPDAKALIENALIEAIKEREKIILRDRAYSNLPFNETEITYVDLEVINLTKIHSC